MVDKFTTKHYRCVSCGDFESREKRYLNRCPYCLKNGLLVSIGNVFRDLGLEDEKQPKTAKARAITEDLGVPPKLNREEGGFVDLPKGEQILGAEIVDDKFMIYGKNSTYHLRYTDSPSKPFKLENMNPEETKMSEKTQTIELLRLGSKIRRIDSVFEEALRYWKDEAAMEKDTGTREHYEHIVRIIDNLYEPFREEFFEIICPDESLG